MATFKFKADMKKLIFILLIFSSIVATGQDWQLDGTRYPNATHQGDTATTETKIPIFNNDNTLNYYLNIGDLNGLVGTTPTLDEVLNEGNISNINIGLTESAQFISQSNSGAVSQLTPNGLLFTEDAITAAINNLNENLDFLIDSSNRLRLVNSDNQSDPDAHVATFYGRVKGKDAQDLDDYVTLNNLGGYIPITDKGISNGVATLDVNGKLTSSQIPEIAITDVLVVPENTISAFASNSGSYTFEQGDVIILDNGNGTFYMYNGGTKTNVNSYFEISASEVDWSQITNKPTTIAGYGITDAVPTSRTISAGTGLTGGGDLTTNRTISANFGTTSGTVLEGNWRPSYSDLTGTNPSYTKTESDGKYLLNTTDELTGNLNITLQLQARQLATTNQGDGASLLTFNTERPWSFLQKNTGGATELALVDLSGSKNFTIGDSNNSRRVIIQAVNGNITTLGTVIAANFNGNGSGITNVNANLLDGIDSANFARTDVGNETFSGTITATNFILTPSDRRLKENFENLSNGYYAFNYKSDSTKTKRYGVIAQDVEKYAPSLVIDGEDGYKKVAYIDLLILKQAELEKRVAMLESEKNSDYYMYGVIVLLFGFIIYSKLEK